MDEFASLIGELELRAGGGGSRRLRGRFPYRKYAVLSDGGRAGGKPRKEQFEPGAFSYSLKNTDSSPIHLLVGHSYDKPLASTENGTLALADTAEALTFDATIAAEVAATSYGQDILSLIATGLAVGISPGFRMPPPRAVPADQAERITNEPYDPAAGQHGAIIRTILQALLFELSVVTRPAYVDATVETDNMTDEEKIAAGWTWQNGVLVPPPETITRAHPLARWRL